MSVCLSFIFFEFLSRCLTEVNPDYAVHWTWTSSIFIKRLGKYFLLGVTWLTIWYSLEPGVNTTVDCRDAQIISVCVL